jgi:hypothetical protein
MESLFGFKLSTAETQLLTVITALLTGVIALATRGGRKADQQTKTKETVEGPETQGLTMRDLMVSTFRSSSSAEELAAAAKKAADEANGTCGKLSTTISENHDSTGKEFKRVHERIDVAMSAAARAEQMARAAAGGRASDETLRASAFDRTPPPPGE